MLSVTLTIQRPYMVIQETLPHAFRDTDDPTTIYGDSGKLCHTLFRDTDNPTTIYGDSGKLCCMLSVTLTIQRPYMVDLGYYREFSCHTRT